MAEAVKVAVRVRPFNKREQDKNSKCIISMDGAVTSITNPETNETKQFTFDYSYWSHDSSQTFADQNTVFQDLGVGVLENAWLGYNVSLFAYGQTGSGKSYSMVGYGSDRGIVPCACEELFRRIEGKSDESVELKVEASMMEIYNERVRDLFNPKNPRNDSGLKVRENPKTGPYVDGLAMLPVKDYKHIDSLMEEGTKARTVAATQMNATSSRAHTIFTIMLTQTVTNKQTMKVTDKVSKISLVDLAGSERAASTGAEGGRLKEGAAINKSLSALGNCISALAEMGKPGTDKGKHFIPYRDSVLTWLLRESLGGNAKTIMIAALSPADINFEETLSTLRYADRAKQIVNAAVVNEDANEKMIRELREEVERLRELAAGAESQELHKYKEELEQSQKLIAAMSRTWEEKVREGEEMENQRMLILREMGIATMESELLLPQLINLNEDPFKSGSIIYALKEGITTVGRPDAAVPQGIKLVGLNMSKEHCSINYEAGAVTLASVGQARTFINGHLMAGTGVTLKQNDRVLFGNNHLFRFNDPRVEQQAEADEPVIDWEFAQKELAIANGQASLMMEDAAWEKQNEEMKKKMEEMEDRLRMDREEARHLIESQQAAIEEQNKKLSELGGKEKEAAKQQLEAERAALKKQQEELEAKLKLQAAQAAAAKLEEERQRREHNTLQDRIIALLPMIAETNGICDELGRGIKVDLKIVPKATLEPNAKSFRRGSTANLGVHDESVVAVRLTDRSSKRERLWPYEKFVDQIYTIRDFYHANIMMDQDGMKEDPFRDDKVVTLVGHAHVYLDSLYYLIDIDLSTSIIDYKGKIDGELSVHMSLSDEKGGALVAADGSVPDSVEQVKDCQAQLLVEIKRGRGLPPHLQGYRIDFKFHGFGTDFRSEPVKEQTTAPQFGIQCVLPVRLDKEMREYLLTEALTLQVWGEDSGEGMGGKGGAQAGKKQEEEKKKQLELKEQRLQQLENALLANKTPRTDRAAGNGLAFEEEEEDSDELLSGPAAVMESSQVLKHRAELAEKEKDAALLEVERLKALLAQRD